MYARQKILTLLMQPQPQRPEALPGARTLSSDASNITGGPSTRLYKERGVRNRFGAKFAPNLPTLALIKFHFVMISV